MKFFLYFLLLLQFSFGFELLLLSEYKDQNVSGWLVSEKLDGVRAYWDGKNLLSRNGKIINSPKEFIENFPPFSLDGELFTSRGEFEKIQSIVMDKSPNLIEWQNIKFHVFDVPDGVGGLAVRLDKIYKFLKIHPNKNIVVIPQKIVKSHNEMMKIYKDVIDGGGEGLVLREPNVAYERKRSKNALKFKAFNDAECEVVAIKTGKGKFSKVMGSVECQDLKSKKIFKIGSGFSDEIRKNPPKIGDIITYKYQNLTKNKLPRFPVFLRIRQDFTN